MTKFNDLLATPPQSFIKDADIESPDQSKLESDFASMAFVFLRDRAPALLPYLLGFEIVDREEDGSRAVGIFGFKMGDDYYYVPTFFVNNQIKGMDLLFSKKTNSFMPLRETWISHILDRSTLRLGKGEQNSAIREDFESPNFWWMAQPPFTPKMASVRMGNAIGKSMNMTDSINDAFKTWNDLQGTVAESLQKDAAFQEAWAGAISALKHDPIDFSKQSADGSPLIAYLQQFGGPRGVETLLKTIQGDVKFANALLSFYPDVKTVAVDEFDASLAPKEAVELKIVADASMLPSDASSGERQRLVRDGFTIIDRRPTDSRSELFDNAYEKQYYNPTEAGLYSLLLPTGSVVKSWILNPAGTTTGLVVVQVENKFVFTADTGAVFVRGAKLEGESAYEAAGSLDSLESGGHFVLVNEKGIASKPFKVRAIIAENDRRVRINVSFDYGKDYSKDTMPGTWDRMYSPSPLGQGDACALQLSDDAGVTLRKVGDDLIVPNTFKALRVVDCYEFCDEQLGKAGIEDDDDYAKRDKVRSAARQVFEAFQPGNPIDLDEAFGKNAIHRLTLESPDFGSTYHLYMGDFKQGPLGYKQAMMSLVGDFKLGVDAAEELIKQAQTDLKARCLIKLAQVNGVGVGMNMPVPPGTYGFDDGTGIPVEAPFTGYSRGEFLGVPPRRDPLVPGFAEGGQSAREITNGGNSGLPESVTGIAAQAQQSGQKSVFDHSTIGGLSKMYDASAAIDMYLPELVKALDRLGRILFIFYWKNEDFSERYGEEDLAEMEDLIRGVFKSYGDLVLKLKEKTVSTSEKEDIQTI